MYSERILHKKPEQKPQRSDPLLNTFRRPIRHYAVPASFLSKPTIYFCSGTLSHCSKSFRASSESFQMILGF
jgi:hypothetical protein